MLEAAYRQAEDVLLDQTSSKSILDRAGMGVGPRLAASA